MINNHSHSSISKSSHDNCCRISFFVILLLSSIVSTTSLIVVLYIDVMKEKAWAEKRKGWMGKWQTVKPFVDKFPLGFLLGFIRNLIVLAIERQSDI